MAVEKRREGGEPESIEVILRTGQSLKLRPIRPTDRQKLRDFFYRLSPRTRYLRFQYAKEHITEEELKYFTEVTPPARYAYVAAIGEAEKEQIVAVARWDLLPGTSNAEVAFTVEDNIQLHGIGTLLLEELAKAALSYGITLFRAQVLNENTRMLEVFDESGFIFKKAFSEGVYHYTIDLKDQEEYSKRQAYREHIARSEGVRKLLNPKRVAIIGASRSPESVGGALFRNMLRDGFKGVVFPVNPKTDSIAGVLSYPTVLDVPVDIDLAVVVVPAEHVPAVVDQCAQKGIGTLVIISAGFGESGPEGRERERQLREKILSYGIRVVGPNCLGVLNNVPDVRLNATFSPVIAPPGNLSIGSQSGALGLALLDHAKSIDLGISSFVSFGNRIDIATDDLLEYWEDDKNTDVIVLYQESFGSPRKFGRIAKRISHKKPIIAVKAGRSLVGARAATSHTGALAASDVAVDALFRQAGVIRVTTIEEMFNAAEVLAHQPLPKGPRVGILTNAGGPGVLAADACEGFGLKVPPLSEETQTKLREFLPKAAAVTNPVDMIATAPPESFRRALEVMLGDPELDSIILIYIPPLVTKPEDIASSVRAALEGYRGGKPVVTCFMMSQATMEGIRKEAGLRPFVFPEDAVQALSLSYTYSLYKHRAEGSPVRFPGLDTEAIRDSVFGDGAERGWMMPEAALDLLKQYGIKAVETRVAMDADAAARAAAELGFPVVMKVRSRRIVHKTDIGGIAVGLASEDEVRKAFNGIQLRVEEAGMLDEMQGVIVQPMIKGGQEMIIGMSVDPLFGPLIMTGLGGVEVELLKDVSFAIHPLNDIEPERMLTQLKSYPLLKGYRGRPPRDIASLKDTILRFSALIEDFPELETIEINPLMVLGEGKGSVAVDARVYIRAQESPAF
ncbi:MAG: GNAT family N-acetyltransferase [Thermodesulfobacteriota bacterium]|nr:MAG: GNAT family N-acetyltransferase [Thermodesulfobacteriota bacterium]